MAQGRGIAFWCSACKSVNDPRDCMSSPDQMEKEQLASEILQYLIDNPNAQDTLDGIVTWWLLERTIRRRTVLVKEVLDNLVADRLVIAQKGADSQTHYKI